MELKELQLVTYEQAVRLKKLGFDWKVDKFYDEYGISSLAVSMNMNDLPHAYSAPTVALALKWMRDEKKITYKISGDIFSFDYRKQYYSSVNMAQYEDRFNGDYEAVESALLDNLLTVLENQER
jgi:hypothetical protein